MKNSVCHHIHKFSAFESDCSIAKLPVAIDYGSRGSCQPSPKPKKSLLAACCVSDDEVLYNTIVSLLLLVYIPMGNTRGRSKRDTDCFRYSEYISLVTIHELKSGNEMDEVL